MSRLLILFITLLMSACKPAPAEKASSTPNNASGLAAVAHINSASQPADKTELVDQNQSSTQAPPSVAGEAEDYDPQAEKIKKYEQEQEKLPDNERSRTGYLNSKEVLIEKSTNMLMRFDAVEIERKNKKNLSRDLKFIEDGKVYGFDLGDVNYCKESFFDVKRSSKYWIEFMDVCLTGDARKGVYSWMFYDRKTHTLSTLYDMQDSNELQEMRGKDPEIKSYNNGKYSVYYPHLKDTVYFDISSLSKGCRWKSGEGDVDNPDKYCRPSTTSDPIEIGAPEIIK